MGDLGRGIDDAGKAVYQTTNRGCVVLIYLLIGLGVLAIIAYFVLRASGY